MKIVSQYMVASITDATIHFNPNFFPTAMKKDFQFKALFFRAFAVFCFFFISQSVFAQVSGTVFRDFNSNGKIDTTASYKETGQIGVIVKAYNASGAEVGTATTNAQGVYSITGVSGPLRIEFSNLPNLDFSSFSGGTSVQFVNGGAANVNFGINYPNDYCQKDPLLATTCYASEDVANSADKVFIKFPLSYTSEKDGNINGTTFGNPSQEGNVIYTPTPPKPSSLATVSDIGSTWGVAWDKVGKKLYTSTYVKRGTRLGSTESTGVIGLRIM
jgi:SdrD B-like domain